MTDVSADTGPLPVFGPQGMMGNLTSAQGQPPAAAPPESASALQPSSPLAPAGLMPQPTPPPNIPNVNYPPMPAQPQQQKLGPAPDAKQYHKNSMAFASAMAVLGAVSSAFTRQSGTASLSAFAGALNGWQQGNLQAYEEAAKKWEQDTKATLDNNRMIMDQYKLALENRKLNIDEQMNEIQVISTKYHHQMMYDAAAAKNYTMVAQIYEKNREFTMKAQEAADKLQAGREKSIEEAKKSPAYWMNHPEEFMKLPPAAQAAVKQFVEVYKMGKGGAIGRSPEDIDRIADAIASGKQPPVLTGLYGASAAVRSKLQEKGVDVAQLQVEWQRAQRAISALNGPQMQRFVGLAKSVDTTIDEARSLSQQLKNSGIPVLNRASLAEKTQLRGNTPEGKLAAKYLAAVNMLKEEFANLAQGGYAPTEPVWKLANQQINANYGVDELGASLDEIQRLIRFRVQAIPGLSTIGPGAPNRYTGQGAAEPAGGAPTRVQSPADAEKLAPGTHYVTPDGQEFVR